MRPSLRLLFGLVWAFALTTPAPARGVELEVGGGMAVGQVDRALWSTLSGDVGVRQGAFALHLRAPLRTSLVRPWQPRQRDWDDRSDWMRLAPRLAWARVASPGRLTAMSVRVGPTGGATLGHGSLVRGYRSGLLLDRWKSGLRVDVDGEVVGLQLLADDVTRFGLVGVRLFVRPLSGFGAGPARGVFARPAPPRSPRVRRGRRGRRSRHGRRSRRMRRRRVARRRRGGLADLTIGISAVADRRAPMAVARDAAGRLRSDAAGRPVMRRGALVLAGVDVGVPIRLSARQHLVPYIDANVASIDGGSGGGSGLHGGVWWSWRPRALHVRLRWEGRRAQGSYRPGWIDGFYELERTQLGEAGRTKAGAWLARAGEERWGHLLEARLQTTSGWAVAASWEGWFGGAAAPDATASARLSSPRWRSLRLQLGWALRPGVGQQSAAGALRWQSDGPWHAWASAQRTWHAEAGRYALRVNAAAGVGARWAW